MLAVVHYADYKCYIQALLCIFLELLIIFHLTFPLHIYKCYIHGDTFIGNDYYASPRSVTFRARDTAASIYISTREDYLLEQDESFRVTVSHPSLPRSTGSDYTVITIKDDDGMYVGVYAKYLLNCYEEIIMYFV